jgi:hypothetical protein
MHRHEHEPYRDDGLFLCYTQYPAEVPYNINRREKTYRYLYLLLALRLNFMFRIIAVCVCSYRFADDSTRYTSTKSHLLQFVCFKMCFTSVCVYVWEYAYIEN